MDLGHATRSSAGRVETIPGGTQEQPEHLPQSFQKNMLAPPYKKQRRSKLQTVRVEEALRKAKGNKTLAADILGVSRSSLYRFFDKQEKGISVH